ncbi:hypothetical protein CTEN210_02817 [Chaetoceros tenuissimus]|uniref:RING-type E3 ubiquitin transferase n=1 Tax=Chaetoceros tenuissimus TaxID=426638 RepID=A0AAD3CI81_9STRA|nr:hypothetical protein CTEN210_02817 [Chaetoceros tenuissimus]
MQNSTSNTRGRGAMNNESSRSSIHDDGQNMPQLSLPSSNNYWHHDFGSYHPSSGLMQTYNYHGSYDPYCSASYAYPPHASFYSSSNAHYYQYPPTVYNQTSHYDDRNEYRHDYRQSHGYHQPPPPPLPAPTAATKEYLSTDNQTLTSQENKNDGQEILGSETITIQKLAESEITEKKDHLYKVCKEKDWDTFQKFLSDATISKADKMLILSCYSLRCIDPIVMGAPVALIQNIIDCLEDLFFGKTGLSMFRNALEWSSEYHVRRFPALKYTTVSYEVIELLLLKGGADLVYLQCRERPVFQEYLGWNGECPRIIKLLLKKDIIIDYLRELDPSPRVQKYIESFTNTGVSPKEFFDWVDNRQFEIVREYLLDEGVSKEAKVKCFTTYSVRYDLPFHKFCERHGPVDIAKLFVDVMGTKVLELKDGAEDTCLHSACHDIFAELMDIDVRDLNDEDFERHHDLIEYILSKTGWKILLETNNIDTSALSDFMRCLRTDLKCVKLVLNLGGEELLDHQGKEGTILHYASDRDILDVDVIKYLVSVGGQELMEAKNHRGKTAESMWPTHLKKYIDRSTKILPALSDDLQCPICFDMMSNVHVITKCCHRFCKSCISQSYEQRGNKCPVCRTDFSFHTDIRKDPLLGKFATVAKQKDDKNVALQVELLVVKEQNRALAAELQTLKRKHNEVV